MCSNCFFVSVHAGLLGFLVFIVAFLFDKYLSRCFWTLSRRTLVVHSNCFLMYSPHRVSISWCLSLHSSLISNTLFWTQSRLNEHWSSVILNVISNHQTAPVDRGKKKANTLSIVFLRLCIQSTQGFHSLAFSALITVLICHPMHTLWCRLQAVPLQWTALRSWCPIPLFKIRHFFDSFTLLSVGRFNCFLASVRRVSISWSLSLHFSSISNLVSLF